MFRKRISISSVIFLFIVFAFSSLAERNLSAQEEFESQEEAVDIEKRVKSLIDSGRFYYKSKKYEAAIHQLEEALALDPENKKAKIYIKDAKAKLEKQAKKEKKRVKREGPLISIAAPPKEVGKILSLDDCIEIAIKNHLPLQIAQKNIRLGQMRLWEARRNLLPTVSARWEESEGKVNARRYVGKKEYIEGQQPIFHGGELYYTMKQADVNLKVVREDYNRIKNDLILQVKKGYYTLVKAKENLRVQNELSEEVERLLDTVNKQFASGIASKLELLNVSSQASQVRFQLASARGDESVAELILKQVMYVDPKETIDIGDVKLEFEALDIDFDKALSAALIHRPEMKINYLMVEYYKYGKRIAGAKGFPKIDVMGSWGLAKEEFTSLDLGTDPDRELDPQWYVGAKVSMPLLGSTTEYQVTKEEWVPIVSTVHGTEATTQAVKFSLLDNLKYYSDKQLADIDFDRARQEFNKIRQDITLEVKESCFNYEKALVQIETASNKVRFQEKDLELMRLKRQMDEALDSNLIESMIKLSQERFGYAQALTDYYIAIASVNKAIGLKDYFKVEERTEGREI